MYRCSLISIDCFMFSDHIHLIAVRALTPAYFTPRLIRSLIFPTWVMAFVILNDSRNKSTVMRSHWVRFFFSFLWNHPSQLCQQSTCSWDSDSWSWIQAPVNQHETDQFLPQEDLPATKMDTLSFQYPGLIIFWLTGAHILVLCWCPAAFPNSASWHL